MLLITCFEIVNITINMVNMDINSLDRFLIVQERMYPVALK